MRYIGIIILLGLCLTLLLFTGCRINTAKPEPASGNLENQEDINQSINNSQSISTEPAEEPGTVYPQQWATGDGTDENPWANDCIKKALDFIPAGGTIFLRAGYYQLVGDLMLDKQINIIGEGINKTIIVTANADGFTITANYVSIKNLTIDGDAQTDNTEDISCIELHGCDYALLEDIETKNAGYYGISSFQVNHSSFQNIYSHNNYRHGVHPGSNTAGKNKHNTYQNIYAWNNGHVGFADRGNVSEIEQTNNVYDNLNCWDNSTIGIQIAYQKGIVLSNSTASGNGAAENFDFGIYLLGVEDSSISNCEAISNVVKGMGMENANNISISNCVSTLNGTQGMYIEASDGINLTNVITKNNGTGIYLDDTSNIVFTSCQSYDDRETPLQDYGLILSATGNSTISLLYCKLTPNKIADMYNPNRVVITVITEKGE